MKHAPDIFGGSQEADGGSVDVLMTADTIGGVWTYCLELARALDPHGITILLATMGPPMSEAQRFEVHRLKNIIVRESGFRLEWMREPWKDVMQAGEWLLRLESEYAPRIIHLNGYAHAVLPWSSPKIAVAHSCVFSWWRAVHGTDPVSEWETYKQSAAAGLRAADAVIAPTHAMLSSICEIYGTPLRSQVIYNARDPSLFETVNKSEYIIAVGRAWDPAKNFIVLDRVAPSLQWPIFIAGPNQAPDSNPSVFGNVRLLGHLTSEQVRGWLAAAPIFVQPAKYEPFGLTVVEAALSKCALVLGDIPSLRELWEGAALFVPPDDTRALRDAINFLIDDSSTRAEMACRAYRRGLIFSPQRMSTTYLHLYRELLGDRAKSRRQACV